MEVNKFIKSIDFFKGTSKKTGRPYYRVDIYFYTVDGEEYRKSIFLNTLEIALCGLKDYFN